MSHLQGLRFSLRLKYQLQHETASSGQEWQYVIYTVRAHTGRSTGRSTPYPVVASNDHEW